MSHTIEVQNRLIRSKTFTFTNSENHFQNSLQSKTKKIDKKNIIGLADNTRLDNY